MNTRIRNLRDTDSASLDLVRHERKCSVCQHPDREAIEEAFLHWHNVAQITEEFDLARRAMPLAKEVRGDDVEEVARGDDFGFLPKLWEVARVSRHQVVRAGGIGAFKENVVVQVGGDLKAPGRSYRMRAIGDELHQLPAEAFVDLELRAG